MIAAMAAAGATPWDEIETVLRWLTEGTEAMTSARARFYARLVVELLNRRGVRIIEPLDHPIDHPLLEHTAPDMPYSVMFRWVQTNSGNRQLEGCVIRRTDGEPFLPSDLARLGWRQMRMEDLEGRRSAARSRQRLDSVVMRRNEPQSPAPVPDGARRRYDPAHFERVARLYDEAVALGDTAPVRYVANQTGLKHSTVKNHVYQARKMGLLPQTEQRKPRGNPPRPTP
jgi:hypothetical protein